MMIQACPEPSLPLCSSDFEHSAPMLCPSLDFSFSKLGHRVRQGPSFSPLAIPAGQHRTFFRVSQTGLQRKWHKFQNLKEFLWLWSGFCPFVELVLGRPLAACPLYPFSGMESPVSCFSVLPLLPFPLASLSTSGLQNIQGTTIGTLEPPEAFVFLKAFT